MASSQASPACQNPILRPLHPFVEIYRLVIRSWILGRSVAFTAARQAMNHTLTVVHLNELVSFNNTTNLRPRHLMKRLSSPTIPRDDFLHRMLENGHLFQAHMLYKEL